MMKALFGDLKNKCTSDIFPIPVFITLILVILIACTAYCTSFVLSDLLKFSDNVCRFGCCLSVALVIFFYLYNLLYIPKGNPEKANILIMLTPDKLSNDRNVIRNKIFDTLSCCNNHNRNYICPNILSRYFFNIAFSENNSCKPFFELYIQRFMNKTCADIIIWGGLENGKKGGKEYYKLKPKLTVTREYAQMQQQLENAFIAETFEINADDTINGFDSTIDIISSYLDIGINLIQDYCQNPIESLEKCVCKLENLKKAYMTTGNNLVSTALSAVKQITVWHFINISYSDGYLFIKQEFIDLCNKYLDLFPGDSDVIITLQYCEMNALLVNGTSKRQLRETSARLLSLFDSEYESREENKHVALANKAYFNLVLERFSEAEKLYKILFNDNSPKARMAHTEVLKYLNNAIQISSQRDYALYAKALYYITAKPCTQWNVIAAKTIDILANKGDTKKIKYKANKLKLNANTKP